MTLKRSLVLAIALLGILSTQFISADEDDDEKTTAAQQTTTDYQSTTHQHQTAQAGVETATAAAQETSEAATRGGVATGTAAAAESTPGSAGGVETGTAAAESTPGTAGGVGTVTAAGESSQQAGGDSETATSAGELSTATSGHVQVGTEGEETGTSPAESNAEGTEALVGAVPGDEESKESAQEYTTGRIENDETITSAQKTKETATAEHTTSWGQTGTKAAECNETCEERPPSIEIKTPTKILEVNVTTCKIADDGEWTTSTMTTETTSQPKSEWTTSRMTTETQLKTESITPSTTTRGIAPNKRRRSITNEISPDKEKTNTTYKYNVTLVIGIGTNTIGSPSYITEGECPLEYNRTAVVIRLKEYFLRKGPGKRQRRQTDDKTEDDTISLPFEVDVEDILDAFKSIIPEINTQSSTLSSITESPEESTITSSTSTPQAVQEQTRKPEQITKPGIWEAHLGLFLTVIILVAVCIVVTSVCCLCMVWRRRGHDRHPDKQPIAMEEAHTAPTAASNPIPDAEIIQDEAPMQERENQAVTPNGGGQHISKADEDNGWVVPLDELSKAEKEKPEVENTRL